MKFETLLAINNYELIAVNNGTYQIYKGETCIASLRGCYKTIKKYFKNSAKNKA